MNYKTKQKMVTAMLSKYGSIGNIELVKVTGSIDPITLIDSRIKTINNLNGVVKQVKIFNKQNTLLKIGDKIAIIDTALKPSLNDSMRIGGVDHKILLVDTLSPGGTDLLYEVYCRG